MGPQTGLAWDLLVYTRAFRGTLFRQGRTMEIRFQRNFSDYREALAGQRVKSLRLKILVAVSLCLIYIIGDVVLVSLGLTLGMSTVTVLAGSLILAKGLSFAHSLWLRRDFRRHPNFARPVQMQIDDAGLHSESDVWSGHTKWDTYVKYGETENLFLLYLGARSVEVIPKRAFSGEETEEFRRLVRAAFPDGPPNADQRSACVENPS
jgi:hypothetical protein